MRSKLAKFALVAAFGLALTFTFSCSGSDNGGNDNGGGNGGSTEQSYNYCIKADNTCLVGPFTPSACNGQVSNSCPNGSSPSEVSSSSIAQSSSSLVPSSSSVEPSSSSAVLSSSSTISSSSYVPSSSSSSILSSSSSTISSSSYVPSSSSSSILSSSSSTISSSSYVPSSSSSSILSSSSIAPSSSSLVASSSSSACTAADNNSTQYCSNGTMKEYGFVTYGEQTYKTVEIGTQTWMAQNLNYNSGRCYGEGSEVNNPINGIFITLSNTEIQANCNKYGRLYNWATAIKVCPKGWHLPSRAEWGILITKVGGSKTAGKYLKATSGWNGEDKYGFSALPGGYLYSNGGGTFFNAGDAGYWWSAYDSSINGASYHNYAIFSYDDITFDSSSLGENRWYSVRCLQD